MPARSSRHCNLADGTYSGKVGLALLCPITSRAKGYPFEVAIPDGLKVTGVVLADQLKSLDWRTRKAAFIATLPADTVQEALEKVSLLLTQD